MNTYIYTNLCVFMYVVCIYTRTRTHTHNKTIYKYTEPAGHAPGMVDRTSETF